jgi:hypothetical protein
VTLHKCIVMKEYLGSHIDIQRKKPLVQVRRVKPNLQNERDVHIGHEPLYQERNNATCHILPEGRLRYLGQRMRWRAVLIETKAVPLSDNKVTDIQLGCRNREFHPE